MKLKRELLRLRQKQNVFEEKLNYQEISLLMHVRKPRGLLILKA